MNITYGENINSPRFVSTLPTIPEGSPSGVFELILQGGQGFKPVSFTTCVGKVSVAAAERIPKDITSAKPASTLQSEAVALERERSSPATLPKPEVVALERERASPATLPKPLVDIVEKVLSTALRARILSMETEIKDEVAFSTAIVNEELEVFGERQIVQVKYEIVSSGDVSATVRTVIDEAGLYSIATDNWDNLPSALARQK